MLYDFNPQLNQSGLIGCYCNPLYWSDVDNKHSNGLCAAHCSQKQRIWETFWLPCCEKVISLSTLFFPENMTSFTKFPSLVTKSPRCPIMKMRQNVSQPPLELSPCCDGTRLWLGLQGSDLGVWFTGVDVPTAVTPNMGRHTDPAQERRAPPRATTCS